MEKLRPPSKIPTNKEKLQRIREREWVKIVSEGMSKSNTPLPEKPSRPFRWEDYGTVIGDLPKSKP